MPEEGDQKRLERLFVEMEKCNDEGMDRIRQIMKGHDEHIKKNLAEQCVRPEEHKSSRYDISQSDDVQELARSLFRAKDPVFCKCPHCGYANYAETFVVLVPSRDIEFGRVDTIEGDSCVDRVQGEIKLPPQWNIDAAVKQLQDNIVVDPDMPPDIMKLVNKETGYEVVFRVDSGKAPNKNGDVFPSEAEAVKEWTERGAEFITHEGVSENPLAAALGLEDPRVSFRWKGLPDGKLKITKEAIDCVRGLKFDDDSVYTHNNVDLDFNGNPIYSAGVIISKKNPKADDDGGEDGEL